MKLFEFKVKAVIFDMDGVITDTMPYHFRAWKKIFGRAGISATKCAIYLREGQPGRVTIKEISREQGVPYDEAKARKMLAAKERLFKRTVRRRFVAGSRGFLHYLKREGFRLALVTGTARHEVHHLMPDRLLKMFDAIVTGTDVRHGKPHPEPYLKALKKLGLPASQAVVIENAPFGVHAAKRAGLRCLAVETSLPRKYLQDAQAVFPSFRELRRKARFFVS